MNTLKKLYQYLVKAGSLLKSPLLLLIRLYWGWGFFQAGLGKLSDINAFIQTLEGMSFPLPTVQAYIAAFIELLGGLCLMAGFASRLAALLLATVMVVAFSTAHVDVFQTIFTNPSSFVAASPFNFLLASLLVLAFGPGRFSVDYFIEKKME